MTFGLSETGFELKRLDDILAEKRQLAISLFSDLLEPSDVVDTSDSSTIGRLINLASVSEAELHEIGQAVYSAFDPNTATGISLDNLVQLSGISRLGSTYSLVTGMFGGTSNTEIPSGSIVGSSSSKNKYTVTSPVLLNYLQASGVVLEITDIENSSVYSVTYNIANIAGTATYTTDSSATRTEILNGLLANINSAHPILDGFIEGNSLRVMSSDLFSRGSFIESPNMEITYIYNLGNLQATEVGGLFDAAGDLTVIKTPVLGWDSVTNPLAVSEGRLVETDEELRLRFKNTKYERSSNILDSLYSALLSIDTVESVTVYENSSGTTDSNGLPEHSFMAVVLGGASEVLAETIWKNKPAGITSVGNTEIEILDSQNFPRSIYFQRPTAVPIFITMTLTTDATYPADGATLIKDAIIAFAKDEFSVGDAINYSRLYTPINSVVGHSVDSLYIGTSASPVGTSSIPMAFDEIGSFSSVNIIVNIT